MFKRWMLHFMLIAFVFSLGGCATAVEKQVDPTHYTQDSQNESTGSDEAAKEILLVTGGLILVGAVLYVVGIVAVPALGAGIAPAVSGH